MQLKPENFCPILKSDCIGLKCSWFMQVRGHNPNTGAEVDEWACAISWLPILLIENSQQQRQTGSAVESFRNEMVKANDISREIIIKTISLQNNNLGKVHEIDHHKT